MALSIIHNEQTAHHPIVHCCVITPDPATYTQQNYQTEFPPLSTFEDPQQRTKHEWKIKTPTSLSSTGVPSSVSHAEATLNWQSENVVAQNKVLTQILAQQTNMVTKQDTILSQVKSIEALLKEIRFKIQNLHVELLQIVRSPTSPQSTTSISQKEAEMKFLKTQLLDLERQHKQKRISTFVDDPWRSPSTPFVKASFDPQPIPQSFSHTPSPSLSLWAPEQAKIRNTSLSSASTSSPSICFDETIVASSKAPDILPIEKLNSVSSFLQSLAQENLNEI